MPSRQIPKKRRRGQQRIRKEEVIYDTITVRPRVPIAQPAVPTPSDISESEQNAQPTPLAKEAAADGPHQVITRVEGRTTGDGHDQRVSGAAMMSTQRIKTSGPRRLSAGSAPTEDPPELGETLPASLMERDEPDSSLYSLVPQGPVIRPSDATRGSVLMDDVQSKVNFISSIDHMPTSNLETGEDKRSSMLGQAMWVPGMYVDTVASKDKNINVH